MKSWVPESLYIFIKEEGCLPTFDEVAAIVMDVVPCSSRRAFARVRHGPNPISDADKARSQFYSWLADVIQEQKERLMA
jgi:hypothetical protein